METILLTTKNINVVGASAPCNVLRTYIKDDEIHLLSYRDSKTRHFLLDNILNKGSFNTIYTFKYGKTIKKGLILRISNSSNKNNIDMELNGIKTQYILSSKSSFIATIVDYGRIVSKNNMDRREYSIIEKYGVSLKDILTSPKITYINLMCPLIFMRDFLKGICRIHASGYAHLDLKPSNILLQDIYRLKKTLLKKINFAIIDFGAVLKCGNIPKHLTKQMASMGFSPPELSDRLFGQKNDIWAYGVICFLVIQNRFYFKAKANKIFIHTDKETIIYNIKRAVDNIFNIIRPRHLRDTVDISEYMHPFNTKENILLLQDFFTKVLDVSFRKRPQSKNLIKHPLFNLI